MNMFCILITFHNHITAYFSNKLYPVTIQTCATKIVNNIFLIKTGFNRIFKDYRYTKSTFRYSIRVQYDITWKYYPHTSHTNF